MQVTLLKNDGSKAFNITPIITGMTWGNQIENKSVSLEFSLAHSDTRFFPVNPCDLGDLVICSKNGIEFYRGIIWTEGKKGRQEIPYVTRDYGFYLKKSTITIQFNNIQAKQAVIQLLERFGIKLGAIPDMNVLIDKIYMMKTPIDILTDILQKAENRLGYTLQTEIRGDSLFIEKRSEKLLQGNFRLAPNIGEADLIQAISEPSRSRTIESMRNRVRILLEGELEGEYEEVALSEDTGLINQYGLLEETVKIDAEDVAKAREVAKILLARLGRVHEKNKVELMGDIRFRAGRLFKVKEDITGTDNTFVIQSAKHTYRNRLHTMELELADRMDVR